MTPRRRTSRREHALLVAASAGSSMRHCRSPSEPARDLRDDQQHNDEDDDHNYEEAHELREEKRVATTVRFDHRRAAFDGAQAFWRRSHDGRGRLACG